MSIELDHLFVCTAVGAPEGDELVRFGLREGAPNEHEGQGTANRRFSFANAMIELFWVSDALEAQNERTRPTLLWQRWERWMRRETSVCPFGVIVRPANGRDAGPPFLAWEYRPVYLADPLAMHIGEAGVEEPFWVYLGFLRKAYREEKFVGHRVGIREITGLTLTTTMPMRSEASDAVIREGVLSAFVGEEPLLEIEFDSKRRGQMRDFRPALPLVFWY